MTKTVSFVGSLLLLLVLAETTSAETLLLTIPGDEELVPLKWAYVTGSTRNWIPGCERFDFLDGGWNPMRFYYNIQPQRQSNSPTFEFATDETGFWQNLCGAKMDPDSFVRIEYNSGRDEPIVLPYSLQIHRDDTNGSSVVHAKCWIDKQIRKDGVNQLLCEKRKLGWQGASSIAEIIVTLVDPPADVSGNRPLRVTDE